jgi:hypothetical protein
LVSLFEAIGPTARAIAVFDRRGSIASGAGIRSHKSNQKAAPARNSKAQNEIPFRSKPAFCGEYFE